MNYGTFGSVIKNGCYNLKQIHKKSKKYIYKTRKYI